MIALILILLYLNADAICRIADARATRWWASVRWEGDWYHHASTDRADALSWARCYPNDAYVEIECSLRGHVELVAARQGV